MNVANMNTNSEVKKCGRFRRVLAAAACTAAGGIAPAELVTGAIELT